jgi:hypothetical protein
MLSNRALEIKDLSRFRTKRLSKLRRKYWHVTGLETQLLSRILRVYHSVIAWLFPTQTIEDGLPFFRETELLRPVVNILLVDLLAAHLQHGSDVAEVLL